MPTILCTAFELRSQGSSAKRRPLLLHCIIIIMLWASFFVSVFLSGHKLDIFHTCNIFRYYPGCTHELSGAKWRHDSFRFRSSLEFSFPHKHSFHFPVVVFVKKQARKVPVFLSITVLQFALYPINMHPSPTSLKLTSKR